MQAMGNVTDLELASIIPHGELLVSQHHIVDLDADGASLWIDGCEEVIATIVLELPPSHESL